MRTMIMLTCALVCLCAVPALAQLDPGPDGIGLYADLDGMINSITMAPGEVEIYVLATGIQAEFGIGSWELGLYYEGPIVNLGHLIPYNHVNVGVFPSFTVGNAQAVRPPAPVIHLMTLTFLVLGEDPVDMYVRAPALPVGGSLGNDLPAYINGAIHSDLRPLYPSSGSVDLPVLRINGPAPVATDAASWANVKAMYR